MLRTVPLMTGEVYHLYNRGAHKQNIFSSSDDYRRFQLLMHTTNHAKPVVLRDIIENSKYAEPFSGFPADKSLVEIFGYALMPNHFHILIRQKIEEGISTFMRKLAIGYSMYFNTKYGHSGTMFQGRFKSRHVDSDPYFKWTFAYMHLNPLDLVEQEWAERRIKDLERAKYHLSTYPFSSYLDFYSRDRPERKILSFEEARHYIDSKVDFESLLRDFSRGRELYNRETGVPISG